MTTTADRLAESLIIAALSDGGMTKDELFDLPWFKSRHLPSFLALKDRGDIVPHLGKWIAKADAERMNANKNQHTQQRLFQ